MGKISEFFNFDNIGGKIKNLTKWSCWITILLIWIAVPIAFIVLLSTIGGAALGAIVALPIAAFLLSLFVWISSWAMYAFGEFIEDTHAMRNKEGTTQEVKEKAMREAEEKAMREAEEKAMREADLKASREAENKSPTYAFVQKDVWYCEKCNTKNMNVRKACWNCGNPKNESQE